MQLVRAAALLCAVAAACATGPTADVATPHSGPRQGSARFSVTSYNVHRIPPLNARRPKIRAEIWGKNFGAAPGLPECFLSYGALGVARVPAGDRVRPIEPENHFAVEGTARFDGRIPGRVASEDAYCRAAP